MDTFKNYALAVVLACVGIAGWVVLDVTHTDTAGYERALVTLVLPLLAVAISKLGQVEKNTNGNTSRMLDELAALRVQNARQAELLAQSAPVTPVASAPLSSQDTARLPVVRPHGLSE